MSVSRKENGSLVKKAGRALVDLVLSLTSHNAVANSAVTEKLQADDGLIFNFTKSGTAYGYKDADGNFVPFKNPTGTKSITANGTYDVTDYASANVNVSTSIKTTTKTNTNAMISANTDYYTPTVDTNNTNTKFTILSAAVYAYTHSAATGNTLEIQGSNNNLSWYSIGSINFTRPARSGATGTTPYLKTDYRYIRGRGNGGGDGNITGSMTLTVYHT